jgi:ectoine hydroxylase-related dioxygenase (phytanoyl-CoA dioxygenase family)
MTVEGLTLRGVPAPTTDLDQARADLRETGIAVLRDALDREALAAVRQATYDAAADDRRLGRQLRYEADSDETNQRVWNLPSRGRLFLDLVEHPLALTFVRETIGWPALLSNISANITGPGGGEMVLHADQTYMPQPWSGIQGVNVVWCVDDFTDANGATRVVPGSHLLNRGPGPSDQHVPTVPLEAPAGAMVVMEGRVWHRTGNNRTVDQHRAGIFAWYTPPIYLPQENWWLSPDPGIADSGSDDLLVLFGYRVGGFGRVNGASLR